MSEAKTGTAKDSGAKDGFVAFSAGAIVFKEGDAGDSMYIIESGEIEIVRKNAKEPLATLGPGDFFGEMAILEDQPRFAGAVAKSDARLLRIERSAFADVLRQNVEIAVRIMRKLAGRQRRSEQRLQDALAELVKLRAATKPEPAPPAPEPKKAPAEKAPTEKAAPRPPAPAVSTIENAQLKHASGQVLVLDGTRSEFLVGRPDPVTGITPEINLGPLDVGRTLSRRHAKILHEGGLYFVREEVGTTNGTFVNGERVKTGTAVPLQPGDKVRFGSVEVEFAAG
ncbi:MAG TPA: cyclic nucleotide-binding domain-containing protein [Rudaea sp.]